MKSLVRVLLFTQMILTACAPKTSPASLSFEDAVQTGVAQGAASLPDEQISTIPAPVSTNTPTATMVPVLSPIHPHLQLLPVATSTEIGDAVCVTWDTQREIGLVTSVISGDTVEAFINGQFHEVRYLGVGAPVYTHGADGVGSEATAKNKEIVENQIITLAGALPQGKAARFAKFGYGRAEIGAKTPCKGCNLWADYARLRSGVHDDDSVRHKYSASGFVIEIEKV